MSDIFYCVVARIICEFLMHLLLYTQKNSENVYLTTPLWYNKLTFFTPYHCHSSTLHKFLNYSLINIFTILLYNLKYVFDLLLMYLVFDVEAFNNNIICHIFRAVVWSPLHLQSMVDTGGHCSTYWLRRTGHHYTHRDRESHGI